MSKLGSLSKVLVLSDHAGLYRAIELCLQDQLDLEAQWVRLSDQGTAPFQFPTEHPALMVAVDLSPYSQPLVVLARLGLIGWVGQVPLLVISDRPFPCDPALSIYHLDMPFAPRELCRKVRRILTETTIAEGD